MIQLLADAATPQNNPPGGLYNALHIYLPFILVLAVMWAFLILPKRNQDKKRQQMLDAMKRGDEVLTSGGIIGKVVDPREDRVLVKVDESNNTKMWFSRTAIVRVTSEDGKVATAK